MKTTLLFFVTLLIPLFSFHIVHDSLTNEERSAAVKYLKALESDLYEAVKGFSMEQLNYKPTADSWSIAECVQHITISEQQIFQLVEMALSKGADLYRR